MVRAYFSFMKNREILEKIAALTADLNPEESPHEAFVFLSQTIREVPEGDNTHDALISSGGNLADLGALWASYLRHKPREALLSLRGALTKSASDNGLKFILPLIEAVILPLMQTMSEDQKAKPALIIPVSKNIREN